MESPEKLHHESIEQLYDPFLCAMSAKFKFLLGGRDEATPVKE
jgi:hypothetical protein